MTYLLDTCILSKLRRLSKYPDFKLQHWIEQYSANLYFISVFSIAEIQAGIAKIKEDCLEHKKYKAELKDWLLNVLIPGFEGRIIEFNLEIAYRWGLLVGGCKQRGINLPVIDSLIAATALQYELVLVTEDNIDFDKTGVTYINPWER